MVQERKHKEHWRKVYAEKAENEVSWFQHKPARSLELIASAAPRKTARIIDVGAGASRLVGHLLQAGYSNLTALDLAEEGLLQARRRLGSDAYRIEWVVADIMRWQPSVRYDVWHDRAVFHFLVEPEERAAYQHILERVVQPGGTVILGTFGLEGPGRCSGLPVMRYSAELLSDEFSELLDLIEHTAEDHITPAGKIQLFQFCRFRRK